MLKKIIKEALTEYFSSEKGQEMIGNIMIRAVSIAMERDMRFEDGTSEPGKTVEKTKRVDILDQIVFYLARSEGALRGCQADAAQARNRATETSQVMGKLLERIYDGDIRQLRHIHAGALPPPTRSAHARLADLSEQRDADVEPDRQVRSG